LQDIIISEEEFKSLKNEESIEGFDYSIHRHIYNIIKKYPDQTNNYLVDFESYESDTNKELYESFGILVDRTRLSRDLDARNYLLLIEPDEDDQEVLNQCEQFIKENMPAGVAPDYFVVNKSFTSYEEMVKWNNLILSAYPESLPFATNGDLKKQRSKEAGIQGIKEDLVELGLEAIDITSSLEKLAEAYDNNNSATMLKLSELEKEVLSKYTGNEVLITSSGKHVSVVAAYLYYKHGIVSHLSFNDTVSFLNRLSLLLFNRSRMLVEDQFKYILELPDVMLRFNDGFQFLIFLNKQDMRAKVRVSYIDANLPEVSNVEQAEFDLDKIHVIPLESEYNMNDANPLLVRPEHDALLELFKILERKINKFDSTVDVTNSFLFESDGVKFVGHIDSFSLQLPGLVYPVHNELTRVYHTFNINDVSSFYPINILPGFKEFVRNAIIEVSKTGYRVSRVKPYHHQHALGLPISYFNNRGPYLLNPEGLNFVTLGLWWEETYKHRSFIVKRLSRIIELQEFRKRSKYISVFGGPHPLLRESFDITEEFLQE
jgi:hypothetical protein